MFSLVQQGSTNQKLTNHMYQFSRYTHYHSILPLIANKEDTNHIFECDINSTLIKVLQQINIISSQTLTKCKISLRIHHRKIWLNYKSLYIDKLHEIHHTISNGIAFKIKLKYKPNPTSNRSNILSFILFPIRSEIPPKNIKSSVIKFISNIIGINEDNNLLLYAKFIMKLTLPSMSPYHQHRIVNSFIASISQKHADEASFESIMDYITSDHHFAELFMDNRDNVWSKFDNIFHPCTDQNRLNHFSTKYRKMCSQIARYFNPDNHNHVPIIKHLLIFLFNEDNDIILDGLRGFDWILPTQRLINGVYQRQICSLYDEKISADSVLFNGYIRMSHRFIPNDLSCIIYSYYNGYRMKQYNFIERIFYLLDEANGYEEINRHWALQILLRISEECYNDTIKILIEEYALLDRTRKLLSSGSVAVDKFQIISNFVSKASTVRESNLIEIMMDVFVGYIGSEFKVREFSVIASACSSFGNVVRAIQNESRFKNILEKYCLVKHVLNLIGQIIMNNNTIKCRLIETSGYIIKVYLKLIEFILEQYSHNWEIQMLCKAQIRENGMLLKNLKDDNIDFDLGEYMISIKQRAKNLLNAIDI